MLGNQGHIAIIFVVGHKTQPHSKAVSQTEESHIWGEKPCNKAMITNYNLNSH